MTDDGADLESYWNEIRPGGREMIPIQVDLIGLFSTAGMGVVEVGLLNDRGNELVAAAGYRRVMGRIDESGDFVSEGIESAGQITWPVAQADWGAICGFGLFLRGQLLVRIKIEPAKVVQEGETLRLNGVRLEPSVLV